MARAVAGASADDDVTGVDDGEAEEPIPRARDLDEPAGMNRDHQDSAQELPDRAVLDDHAAVALNDDAKVAEFIVWITCRVGGAVAVDCVAVEVERHIVRADD